MKKKEQTSSTDVSCTLNLVEKKHNPKDKKKTKNIEQVARIRITAAKLTRCCRCDWPRVLRRGGTTFPVRKRWQFAATVAAEPAVTSFFFQAVLIKYCRHIKNVIVLLMKILQLMMFYLFSCELTQKKVLSHDSQSCCLNFDFVSIKADIFSVRMFLSSLLKRTKWASPWLDGSWDDLQIVIVGIDFNTDEYIQLIHQSTYMCI